jgi:hypothetical protein
MPAPSPLPLHPCLEVGRPALIPVQGQALWPVDSPWVVQTGSSGRASGVYPCWVWLSCFVMTIPGLALTLVYA